MMYTLNESIKLHEVVMMIKIANISNDKITANYNLIKLQHIHVEQMHSKSAKVRC